MRRTLVAAGIAISLLAVAGGCGQGSDAAGTTTDRDDILSAVIPWLESHNIHSRGRFGLFGRS